MTTGTPALHYRAVTLGTGGTLAGAGIGASRLHQILQPTIDSGRYTEKWVMAMLHRLAGSWYIHQQVYVSISNMHAHSNCLPAS